MGMAPELEGWMLLDATGTFSGFPDTTNTTRRESLRPTKLVFRPNDPVLGQPCWL